MVIHQLNNATQLLANFQALLSLGGAEEILRQRSGDIADTARSVHELGYVLAVIASASGADLLLERREPRGLEWILETVRDGLRREGRDLARPRSPLPNQSAAVGEGWELPWAFGALLYCAGLAVAAGERLEWSLERSGERWSFSIEGLEAERFGELPQSVVERLPGAVLAQASDRLRIEFPGEWLRAQHPTEGGQGSEA